MYLQKKEHIRSKSTSWRNNTYSYKKSFRSSNSLWWTKDDFIPFLVNLKNAAADAVEDTPNLLPKLKEAGVVDAGGKGIFYVFEGFEKSVTDPEMLKDLARIANSQVNRKTKIRIYK